MFGVGVGGFLCSIGEDPLPIPGVRDVPVSLPVSDGRDVRRDQGLPLAKYIYIYIYRERERSNGIAYVFVYIYIYMCNTHPDSRLAELASRSPSESESL